MLDEMTAALPADLTERVLHVIGNQRGSDRCIIFISHRLIEIAAVCDRATVLREGATVGVVDINEGSEDTDRRPDAGRTRGQADAQMARRSGARQRGHRGQPRHGSPPATCASGAQLHDVSFELRAGEVLGVAALEGQGQDELFDILAGARRPDGGELLVDGAPVSFRHPADAIRAGLVYVPADRAEALLMQRSVRENVALPYIAGFRSWGPIDVGRERRKVDAAIARLQIDTRAASEVRRCPAATSRRSRSPAGWPAASRRCSASTRRAASTSGPSSRSTSWSASSRRPVPRSCSTPPSSRRSSWPATGRSSSSVAGSSPRSRSTRPTNRPCCAPRTTCRQDVPMPEEVAAEERRRRCPRADGSARRPGDRRTEPTGPDRRVRMSAAVDARHRGAPRDGAQLRHWAQRNSWTLALLGLFAVILLLTYAHPAELRRARSSRASRSARMPLAFAAVAQAIVVISGGIDLSIGSMMALTSVTAAVLMKDQAGERSAIAVVLGVLVAGHGPRASSTGRSSSSRACPTSS